MEGTAQHMVVPAGHAGPRPCHTVHGWAGSFWHRPVFIPTTIYAVCLTKDGGARDTICKYAHICFCTFFHLLNNFFNYVLKIYKDMLFPKIKSLSAYFCVQVSVGTLLAFTIVAVSILILRYVPPDEVPLPPSLQGSIDSMSQQYTTQEDNIEDSQALLKSNCKGGIQQSLSAEASAGCPLIVKENSQGNTCL